MCLFACLHAPSDLPAHNKKIDILSPVSGSSETLESASEVAFQQRMFGEGALVSVSGFKVVSPFSGKIEAFDELANRIRLRDKHGIRLQIQCGLVSHTLRGVGFKRHVKPGEMVKSGQPLLEFDLRKMRLSLPDVRFAITVLNSDRTKGIAFEPKKVAAHEDILFSVLV